MSEILQEIPCDQLENLRDLFKKNWPHTMHIYYLIDNDIDWIKRNISNKKFFCLEGKWDDGTFISIQNNSMYEICMYSIDRNCKRLKNALETSNIIKWDNTVFSVIHEDNYATIMNEVNNRDMDVLHQYFCNMWWISKEIAILYEYNIPSDVYLAPLKEEDVDKIDALWPYRSSDSKIYLKELIIYNGGFGIYLKSDNTLCSWIMKNHYGAMAIFQTDEKHKRKGYGTILSKHFSKYWAEKGLHNFCFIMTYNKPCQKLFEKLGWKKEHDVTWIFCKSKIVT